MQYSHQLWENTLAFWIFCCKTTKSSNDSANSSQLATNDFAYLTNKLALPKPNELTDVVVPSAVLSNVAVPPPVVLSTPAVATAVATATAVTKPKSVSVATTTTLPKPFAKPYIYNSGENSGNTYHGNVIFNKFATFNIVDSFRKPIQR